jgi:hypothetical protein
VYDLAARNVLIETVKGLDAWVLVTPAEFADLRGQGYAIEMLPGERLTVPGRSGPPGVYHDYLGLTEFLQTVAAAYPGLVRLTSFGRSVQGKELWAVKITGSPDQAEDEPEVLIAGGMHGDEPVGIEMCVYLIDYLVSNANARDDVAALVRGREIWVVPCLNPDGRELSRRFNANWIDLNRNYPVPDGSIGGDSTFVSEPETQATMDFLRLHHFALAVNLHAGALVVSCLWDYTATPAPDDGLADSIGRGYASRNPAIAAGSIGTGGVVRGWFWYPVFGSLQDWHYQELGSYHATIEISDAKAPPESELPQFWSQNRDALLHLITAAGTGLHGQVSARPGGQALGASINVRPLNRRVSTDPAVGDYHRLLAPGTYAVEFSASGYLPTVIDPVTGPADQPLRLDVQLAAVPDSDGDGLPDAWELTWFHDLSQAATDDPDRDGLSNLQEWQLGTDPTRYLMTLTPGWNLIALACLPLDNSVTAVLGDRVLNPAWVWDRDRYEPTTALLPLRGHWVYCTASTDVQVEIHPP